MKSAEPMRTFQLHGHDLSVWFRPLGVLQVTYSSYNSLWYESIKERVEGELSGFPLLSPVLSALDPLFNRLMVL